MTGMNDKVRGVAEFLAAHPGIGMFEVVLPDIAGSLRASG